MANAENISVNNTIRRIAGASLCLFALAGGFLAHAGTIVRTAAQTDTAPKYIASSDSPTSPIVGMCIDINRALERLSPGLQFVGDQTWIPASRVDSELSDGMLDSACGISKTTTRLENFYFVDPPLFSSKYVLIARANDAVVIHGWQDVRDLGADGIVLVDHGFGAVSRLQKLDLQVDDGALGAKSNLLKLRVGRGRFYYHRLLGLKDEVRHLQMEHEFRILPAVMDVQPFYLVFGRHAPPEMVAQVRRAVEQLASSGELDKIVKKWSGVE